MYKMGWVIALLAGVFGAEGTARAATLPLIEGLPAEYTPGTPFDFEVRVPDLPNFRAFTVQLVLSTEVINPDLAVTAASPGAYPFAVVPTYPSSTPGPAANEVSLTLSDSSTAGVFTTAGVKDLLAVVTVTPGPTLTGRITVYVGDVQLTFNDEGRPPDSLPEPIPVDQSPAPAPTPVPAPAGVILVGVAGVVMAGRAWLLRATC